MSVDFWDLLLLDRPTNSSDVVTGNEEQKSFAVLPFFAVPYGEERPSLLKITKVWERYSNSYLNLLLGIDFCMNKGIDVLNLSVGPDPNDSFDPNDPLQIATRTAYKQSIPVVVAAGNSGPEVGTLAPLAQASWVIAVGATDPEGRLLKSSSRGISDGPCPTVVSDGTPGPLIRPPDPKWPQWEAGTSFAAPKVARVAIWVQMCLRLIFGNLSDQQAGRWTALSNPLRFPLLGLADTGVDPNYLPPLSQMANYYLNQGEEVRVSRGKQEQEWYAQVVAVLRQSGVACQVSAEPGVVRRAIELIARPLQGYAPSEVGAGFVSDQEAEAFLSSLLPTRWLQLFCPEAANYISKQTFDRLDSELGPLWTPEQVQVLRELFREGTRLVVARVY